MVNILAEKIRKTYNGIQALKEVNLSVDDGEYVCIVGPSGCGKTTLIKSIAGIVTPDAGRIVIDNRDVSQLSIEDRGIGYVFQEIALFPHMTLTSNVGYGPMVRGDSPREREGPVKQMLGMMELEDQALLYPGEMSGGARQKTAIARALATGGNVLLLDEPLGMLDLKVRTVLRYELHKLVKDLHLTAIHVTHDQEEALSISDRVVIMRAGEIIEVGQPTELYLHPRQLFTAKFLGEANFMEGSVKSIGDHIRADISGTLLDASPNAEVSTGDRCVLVIRPEFIKVSRDAVTSSNSLRAQVRDVGFLGDVIRYEVLTENNLTLIVKDPIHPGTPEYRPLEEVTVTLPEVHILAYRHPGGDLDKELSLE